MPGGRDPANFANSSRAPDREREREEEAAFFSLVQANPRQRSRKSLFRLMSGRLAWAKTCMPTTYTRH